MNRRAMTLIIIIVVESITFIACAYIGRQSIHGKFVFFFFLLQYLHAINLRDRKPDWPGLSVRLRSARHLYRIYTYIIDDGSRAFEHVYVIYYMCTYISINLLYTHRNKNPSSSYRFFFPFISRSPPLSYTRWRTTRARRTRKKKITSNAFFPQHTHKHTHIYYIYYNIGSMQFTISRRESRDARVAAVYNIIIISKTRG